jgi:Divergent InlB B-repeat domain
MLNRIGVFCLIVLVGCGGGDNNVTNPPAAQSFTLSVNGSGTGSGQVATAPTTNPAINCQLAPNGVTSGVCSATYPEGTSVSLTVAATAGSKFDTWTGDAASCGGAATCSIAMSANKTATAQLTATPTTAIQITSDTFYLDPDFAGRGAVIWVFEAKNTSSQIVDQAEIQFTSHDASGNVLASDQTFVGPIPPGETRAGQGFADYLGSEATVDIQVGEVQFATQDPNLGAAQITSSNWRPDSTFAGTGAVIWTVEVQNMTGVQLESVEVDIVVYNSAGRIIATDATFVGPIPPGEKRSSQGYADYHGNEASAKFQIASVR